MILSAWHCKMSAQRGRRRGNSPAGSWGRPWGLALSAVRTHAFPALQERRLFRVPRSASLLTSRLQEFVSHRKNLTLCFQLRGWKWPCLLFLGGGGGKKGREGSQLGCGSANVASKCC